MTNLIGIFRAGQRVWRKYRQTWDEARLSLSPEPDGLATLNHDIETSLSDMALITAPHAGPDTLMPLRLRKLDIDPRAIENLAFADFQAMQQACSGCTFWRRCAHDLSSARTHDFLPDYCANSRAIGRLKAGRDDRHDH